MLKGNFTFKYFESFFLIFIEINIKSIYYEKKEFKIIKIEQKVDFKF